MRHFCGVLVVLLLGSQLVHAQGHRPYGPPGRPVRLNPTNSNGTTYVLVAGNESEAIDVKEKLDNALLDSGCPIVTRGINWAKYDTATANYRGQDVQLQGAALMVYEVKTIRQNCPASAIVLLGYSAGTRVVLLAAEQLPPGCVDRIILLAPAVSACYDIRGALRASKGGVDVFYSNDDGVLEFRESEIGTADGLKTVTAGRYGFLLAKSKQGKDPIFNGLRQYDLSQCGVIGGHFATIYTSFLRRYVVPMIPCGQACTPPPPPAPPVPTPPPTGPYPPPGSGNVPPSTYPAPVPVPPVPAPTPGYNAPAGPTPPAAQGPTPPATQGPIPPAAQGPTAPLNRVIPGPMPPEPTPPGPLPAPPATNGPTPPPPAANNTAPPAPPAPGPLPPPPPAPGPLPTLPPPGN